MIDKVYATPNEELRDMLPQPDQPIKLAKPVAKEINGGTVYYYSLPADSGLDKQLAPNAGLSEKVLIGSLLPQFSARLIAESPLTATSGPLLDTGRPFGAAFHLDFAGLLTAISPWIDYGITLSSSPEAASMAPQVNQVIEVLQCFRGVSGVTYQEGNAMVTHSLWRFEDLR